MGAMEKKERWVGGILAFVFIIALPAWGDTPRLKVGVISALSGGLATIGGAVRNGIELARADSPELFTGHKLLF